MMDRVTHNCSRTELKKELELTDISISYKHKSVRFFYQISIIDNGEVIKKEKKNIYVCKDSFKDFCNNLECVNEFAIKTIQGREEAAA